MPGYRKDRKEVTLASSLRETIGLGEKHKWKRRPEILLCPNVPKPLHGVAPRVVLGKSWWDLERRSSYESTDFHCAACGVDKYKAKWHKWLEGHELYDIDYRLGRMVYLETVPLCHFCHNFIHDGRLKELTRKGEIPQKKTAMILAHGNSVLRAAGLQKLPHWMREVAMLMMLKKNQTVSWGDWRLVIGENEYPPKFKDFNEWRAYHDGQNRT